MNTRPTTTHRHEIRQKLAVAPSPRTGAAVGRAGAEAATVGDPIPAGLPVTKAAEGEAGGAKVGGALVGDGAGAVGGGVAVAGNGLGVQVSVASAPGHVGDCAVPVSAATADAVGVAGRGEADAVMLGAGNGDIVADGVCVGSGGTVGCGGGGGSVGSGGGSGRSGVGVGIVWL